MGSIGNACLTTRHPSLPTLIRVLPGPPLAREILRGRGLTPHEAQAQAGLEMLALGITFSASPDAARRSRPHRRQPNQSHHASHPSAPSGRA